VLLTVVCVDYVSSIRIGVFNCFNEMTFWNMFEDMM